MHSTQICASEELRIGPRGGIGGYSELRHQSSRRKLLDGSRRPAPSEARLTLFESGRGLTYQASRDDRRGSSIGRPSYNYLKLCPCSRVHPHV